MIFALAEDVEVTHGADGPAGTGTRIRFRLPTWNEYDDVIEPALPVAPTVFDGVAAARTRLVEEVGDGLRLTVEGELDLATAGAVGERLFRRLAELPAGVPVVLDLRATTYLASAGVGMVLEARAKAAAGAVPFRVVTAAGSAPDRILALGGLGDLLADAPATPCGDGTTSPPVARS
jgi:anti-anti-sigma factor